MKPAFLAVGAAIVLATLYPANSRGGILGDGEFTPWSFTISGGTGGSVMREPTGGNPDARLNISTSAFFGTNTITAIKDDFVTSTPFQGDTYSFSIDILSGPGAAGDGQALLLLVQQGDDIYGTHVGVTGVKVTYTTLTFNGTLIQTNFAHLMGAGPNVPDFSTGIASKFGFAGRNSDSSITNFYDNFRLETLAVPEPGAAICFLSGVLAFCGRRRSRRPESSQQD